MAPIKNCQNCPVWKKSLFRDFDNDLLSYLEKAKEEKILKKGDVLFRQNAQVEGLYCHAHGLAKVLQRDMSSDKIRFSRLVYPGDTSGHRSIFIDRSYKGTCQIISEDAQACFIPSSDVLYFLSGNPEFAKNLIIKISNELHQVEEEKLATKERTVRSRLALLLHTLASEYSDKLPSGDFQLKSEITKREIANLLLVADETIIRLMSDMQKEGLISYNGKYLVVADLEELKRQTIY